MRRSEIKNYRPMESESILISGNRPKCRLCNAWLTNGLCQNPECHNWRIANWSKCNNT